MICQYHKSIWYLEGEIDRDRKQEKSVKAQLIRYSSSSCNIGLKLNREVNYEES